MFGRCGECAAAPTGLGKFVEAELKKISNSEKVRKAAAPAKNKAAADVPPSKKKAVVVDDKPADKIGLIKKLEGAPIIPATQEDDGDDGVPGTPGTPPFDENIEVNVKIGNTGKFFILNNKFKMGSDPKMYVIDGDECYNVTKAGNTCVFMNGCGTNEDETFLAGWANMGDLLGCENDKEVINLCKEVDPDDDSDIVKISFSFGVTTYKFRGEGGRDEEYEMSN